MKYVFAEVEAGEENLNLIQEVSENNDQINDQIDSKIKILEDEKKIIEETNLKFFEENENLKTQIIYLNSKISTIENEFNIEKEKVNQSTIDEEELEFLRLNLLYSHKCQTRKLFSTGYKVGTPEYKECIMNRGKNND